MCESKRNEPLSTSFSHYLEDYSKAIIQERQKEFPNMRLLSVISHHLPFLVLWQIHNHNFLTFSNSRSRLGWDQWKKLQFPRNHLDNIPFRILFGVRSLVNHDVRYIEPEIRAQITHLGRCPDLPRYPDNKAASDTPYSRPNANTNTPPHNPHAPQPQHNAVHLIFRKKC